MDVIVGYLGSIQTVINDKHIDSRFKNGLLQFQHKSTWYTSQNWSPGGLICPKYNQIELHNIDLFGTTG